MLRPSHHAPVGVDTALNIYFLPMGCTNGRYFEKIPGARQLLRHDPGGQPYFTMPDLSKLFRRAPIGGRSAKPATLCRSFVTHFSFQARARPCPTGGACRNPMERVNRIMQRRRSW